MRVSQNAKVKTAVGYTVSIFLEEQWFWGKRK